MKIEVGKTYRTRSGDVVEIVQESLSGDYDPYPFRGDNGEFYTTAGNYYAGGEVVDLDLVQEITSPQPEARGIYDEAREAMQQRLADPPFVAEPGVIYFPPIYTDVNGNEHICLDDKGRAHVDRDATRLAITRLRRGARLHAVAISILALLAIVFSRTANAADIAWMPNAVGGEIVLTNISKSCPPEYLIAYSRGPDGTFITGCWLIGDRYVMIRWSESQRVVLFRPEQFQPIEPRVSPTARPEMRL